MFVTVINDCRDSNAFGRQLTRVAALFNCPVISVPVTNELEAAGNLVDMLDAAEETGGVFLVNVAPRHGKAKQWPNGTPFGYFRLGNHIVVTTIDGYTLSLVKKLGMVPSIELLDIPTVLDSLVTQQVVTPALREHIVHTQFRSFEFAPRLARWLLDGHTIPSTSYPLSNVADVAEGIWYVDNFGNCKTTLLPQDVHFTPGKTIDTPLGTFPCYSRLKDVPHDVLAMIVGSSGYKEDRFLEIVYQGSSAWEKLTPVLKK